MVIDRVKGGYGVWVRVYVFVVKDHHDKGYGQD